MKIVFVALTALIAGFLLYGLLRERYGSETASRAPFIVLALLLSPCALLLPKPVQPIALCGLIVGGFALARLGRQDRSSTGDQGWRSVIAFGLIAGLSFLPFTSGFGGIAIPGGPDDFANGFASLVFLSHVLADGALPLWNNANWIGNPLGGDPMWGVWFPINLWFSAVVALFGGSASPLPVLDLWYQLFNLYRVTISLVGGVGCYLLIRYFRVPRIGALIGASYLTFDINLQFYNWTSLCLAPWFILYCGKAIGRPTLLYAAVAGALLGTMVLGGQVKIAVYVGLMALGFIASWLGSARQEPALAKRTIGQYGASAVVALLVAFMVSAPLLIGAKTYINAGAWRWANDGRTLAPKAIRAEEGLRYVDTGILSFKSPREFSAAVIGRIDAVGLFLLVLAFAYGRERRTVFILAGTWLCLALVALPGYVPLQRLLYSALPGWSSFRAHSQIMFPLSVVTALLVGLGYRGFAAILQEHRASLRGAHRVCAVLLLAIGLNVALDAIAIPLEARDLRRHALQAGLLTIAAASIVLIRLGGRFAGTEKDRTKTDFLVRIVGPAFLGLVVSGKMLALHPDAFSPANYWNEPPDEFAMSRDLETFLRPHIAAARESGALFRIDTRDVPFTAWYAGFVYDWETIAGYGGLALRSAADAVWGQSPSSNNVRFIIVRRAESGQGIRTARDVLRDHQGARIVYSNRLFDVIELTDWSPRLEVLACRQDDGTLLEGIKPDRFTRDRVSLVLPAGEPCRILHRTSHYPRWKAKVDGRETTVDRHKGWQIIQAPGSQHMRHVVFYYDESPECAGAIVMACGYLLALTCLLLACTRYSAHPARGIDNAYSPTNELEHAT